MYNNIQREIEKARLESSFDISSKSEKKQELLQSFQDIVFWETLNISMTADQLQLVYHKFVEKVLICNGNIEGIILKV
jgi:Mlc titration factor MtfA (ptsG expression regulator)